MRDYFGEFLLNTPTRNFAGGTVVTNLPIKTHLIWALVASSGIFLSWKASELYNQYKFMTKKPKTKKKAKKAKKKTK